MRPVLSVLAPLATLGALLATPGQAAPPNKVVSQATAQKVPAVPLPAAQKSPAQPVGLKFLSWNEKLEILKAAGSVFKNVTPGTVLTLTVNNPTQTLSGISAAMGFHRPLEVTPGVVEPPLNQLYSGVASFNPVSGMPGPDDPAVILNFRPRPNKQYVIEADTPPVGVEFRVLVVVDGTTAFTQASGSRILILFPGTAKPQESYIRIQGGHTPTGQPWTFYSCQITELNS